MPPSQQPPKHQVRAFAEPVPVAAAPPAVRIASSPPGAASADASPVCSSPAGPSYFGAAGEELASAAGQPKAAASTAELRSLVFSTLLCNVTEHSHLTRVTSTISVLWKFLVAQGKNESGDPTQTMVIAPLDEIPSGFKESLVTLMEYGEEELDCENVAVVLKRDGPDRATLVKLFMYFGFELVTNEHLPAWIDAKALSEQYFFMISPLR